MPVRLTGDGLLKGCQQMILTVQTTHVVCAVQNVADSGGSMFLDIMYFRLSMLMQPRWYSDINMINCHSSCLLFVCNLVRCLDVVLKISISKQ